jgi:Zn-dependent peptidase ImmA (M78 family)
MPQSKWQAIRQGEAVAADERRRMGLDQHPVADPPKLLLAHGIRAFLFDLPDDVSGVSLMDRRWGLAVIVNRGDARVRSRFSWIHELGHVLMDRDQKATVTRSEDRDRREEVRANAFAAAFLMPEGALRESLARLDRARPSRERLIVTDGDSNATAAERRSVAGRHELTLEDVAAMADELGVSHLALLYRLLNLKLINQGTFDALRSDEQQRGSLLRKVRHSNNDWPDPHQLYVPPDFATHLLTLGVRAYSRDLVARSKVHELGKLVGMASDDIELQLDASGVSSSADVVLPDGFE